MATPEEPEELAYDSEPELHERSFEEGEEIELMNEANNEFKWEEAEVVRKFNRRVLVRTRSVTNHMAYNSSMNTRDPEWLPSVLYLLFRFTPLVTRAHSLFSFYSHRTGLQRQEPSTRLRVGKSHKVNGTTDSITESCRAIHASAYKYITYHLSMHRPMPYQVRVL